jgi:uncharacterized protein (TIGR02466 family)
MNVIGVFPEPFLILNIKDQIDIASVESLITLASTDLIINGNNKNYFSKNTQILNCYPELKQIVEDKLNYFVQNIFGEASSTLKLTQSWMNVNPKGSFHHKHNHINSIVSGVVYLSVDDESGNFVIYKERQGRLLTNNITKENEFTFQRYVFKPNNFDMYLFPSNMQHSVEINRSNTDRISISFNSFYNCILQDENDLSMLDLRQ